MRNIFISSASRNEGTPDTLNFFDGAGFKLEPLRMRKVRTFSGQVLNAVCSALMVFFCSQLSAKTPQQMLKNVESLSQLGAVVGVCQDSVEFKKLPNKLALRSYDLNMRIESLVERIGKHYRDESLVTAYTLAMVSFTESPQLRKEVYARFKKACAPEMFNYIDSEIRIAERSLGDFMGRNRPR